MATSSIALSSLGIVSIGFGWLISEFVFTTLLDTKTLRIIKTKGLQVLVLIGSKLVYLAVPLAVLYGWATNTTWWQCWGIPLVLCLLLQVYSVALYRDFRMTRHRYGTGVEASLAVRSIYTDRGRNGS